VSHTRTHRQDILSASALIRRYPLVVVRSWRRNCN